MAFRKEVPQQQAPTVREMVARYGDKWYLFCASQAISNAVWRGDKMYADFNDASLMRRCEKGERDRVDEFDIRARDIDLLPPVQVEHVFPPIPERAWDYRAYRDPEPGHPVGYGSTPFAAINDLIEQEIGDA